MLYEGRRRLASSYDLLHAAGDHQQQEAADTMHAGISTPPPEESIRQDKSLLGESQPSTEKFHELGHGGLYPVVGCCHLLPSAWMTLFRDVKIDKNPLQTQF